MGEIPANTKELPSAINVTIGRHSPVSGSFALSICEKISRDSVSISVSFAGAEDGVEIR